MQELIPILSAHPLAFRSVALVIWLIATLRDSRRPDFGMIRLTVMISLMMFLPVPGAAVVLLIVIVTELMLTLLDRRKTRL